MNNAEIPSVWILKDLIENHGVIGVKTSFEDEGASFNDVIQLKELCNLTGTNLFLKISGAEAKRDLEDSLIIGVRGIIAPMIESPFALDKFVRSAIAIFSEDIISSIQLGINIESLFGYNNFDEIIKADGFNYLSQVTLGRVDFSSSMGKDRSFADSPEMLSFATNLFYKTKETGKKVCLGGAITIKSVEFIKNLHKNGLLDIFETRNVIYDPAVILHSLKESILVGQKLELSVLNYRRKYHLYHANKEVDRIKILTERINKG